MSKKRAFTVYYDDDSGELYSADESKDFANETNRMKLDVYNDVHADIASRLGVEQKEFEKELTLLELKEAGKRVQFDISDTQ